MLRIAIYTTLIAILMLGAASAQTDKPGVPGYSNALRTDLEKKNDREIDRRLPIDDSGASGRRKKDL